VQDSPTKRSVTRSWVQQALLPSIDWLTVQRALQERSPEGVARLLKVCAAFSVGAQDTCDSFDGMIMRHVTKTMISLVAQETRCTVEVPVHR
jgi:hypothetical protein